MPSLGSVAAMALSRGTDGSDGEPTQPVAKLAEIRHHQRVERSSLLADGTLACPRCDAPVALPTDPLSVTEPLGCPYCGHGARVRDFLSLAAPSRPARVEVRVTGGRGQVPARAA
jgi:hypothetical protein